MQPAKFILGVLCAASVLWMGDAYANGKTALRGIVPDAQATDFLAFVTASEGDGTAAIELEVDAQIESIGPAVVNINASWQCPDCDAPPLNNPMVLYSIFADHRPCALVNNSEQLLPDLIGGGLFLYTAKVTITSKNGNHVIVGDISGGSVCQLEETSFGLGQSINQWLFAFQINPDESSGKFAHAIGQGLIDLKFDTTIVSLPGDPLIFEGFVQPFQIFLNLDTN
jgi:hypothetical protein